MSAKCCREIPYACEADHRPADRDTTTPDEQLRTVSRPPIPNLFIIGAMKSGTTSLHQYLSSHPRIFMSEPKEPGYFVEELTWSRGKDWYLSLFADAGDAAVVGESSTHYTKLPTYRGVPERIQRFSSDARFVYVMRDPVERAVSHYWHNVRSLEAEAERRDPLTAVREDPVYQSYSDYVLQLQPYLDLFGAERVWTLTFESLIAAPAREVERLLNWLAVEPALPDSAFAKQWNVRPEDLKKARGLGLLNRFRYTRLWSLLSGLVPKSVRRLGSHLAEEDVMPDAAANAETVSYLRRQLAPRVRSLEQLLGREFPEWKTVSNRDDDTVTREAS